MDHQKGLRGGVELAVTEGLWTSRHNIANILIWIRRLPQGELCIGTASILLVKQALYWFQKIIKERI
uniref:Uncharacterized protein n=1 Tax=Anguilla anguilla TaxID=7936 RepID=A0A0E9WFM0_ANGAN